MNPVQDNQRGSNYSRYLPIANINRIMKKALPQTAKIAKDAKEAVQECVSEFISFITSEACEKCKTEKRKTINGQDIIFSVNILGFENYVQILKLYLNKYRDSLKNGEKGDPTIKKNLPQGSQDEEDEQDEQQKQSEV